MIDNFMPYSISQEEFESHQEKLLRLSKEVLRQHESDTRAEISNPARIAATYDSGFLEDYFRSQAGLLALTAATVLDVPNSDINVVFPDKQEAVVSVRNGIVTDPETMTYNDSYCKNVIATGRELSVELAANHPLVCDTTFAIDNRIVSYLGVPIAEPGGYIVGVLCVWSGEERDWTVADVYFLNRISMKLTTFLREHQQNPTA